MIDMTKARGKEEEKKERTDEDETKDDEDEAKMMMSKEVVRDACEEGGYTVRRNSSLGVNECTTTETTKGGEGGEGSSYGVSLGHSSFSELITAPRRSHSARPRPALSQLHAGHTLKLSNVKGTVGAELYDCTDLAQRLG